MMPVDSWAQRENQSSSQSPMFSVWWNFFPVWGADHAYKSVGDHSEFRLYLGMSLSQEKMDYLRTEGDEKLDRGPIVGKVRL